MLAIRKLKLTILRLNMKYQKKIFTIYVFIINVLFVIIMWSVKMSKGIKVSKEVEEE
tara:strand:+ start:291 stop:461 length:171 start_codon:yes stop_codon:yes gene_type:complete